MKEETVVYIKVPSSKFPTTEGLFITDKGPLTFVIPMDDRKPYWAGPLAINWWMEPVPLSSLLQEGAVEFAEWLLSNYRKYDFTREGPTWITEKDHTNDNACPEEYKTSELFNSPEFKKHLEDKYAKS